MKETSKEEITEKNVIPEASKEGNKEEFTSDNVKNTLSSREISNANLIPFTSEQSQEEAKKNGSKGGIKSGEVRKARKTAKELLTSILAQNLTDEQIEEILGNASGLLGNDKSAYNVMMVRALQGAMSGDVRYSQFIRDTVGDAPVQKAEVQATIDDSQKAIIDNVTRRLLG